MFKLIIKTPERRRSTLFIVNFEQFFFSCSSVSSSTYMSIRKPFGCLCTIFFFVSSDIRNPAIQSKLIKSMIKFFSDCKFILLVAFVFNNYKACWKTKENISTN